MTGLTLKPLVAVDNSAGIIARVPFELAALTFAPAPWTCYVAFTEGGEAVGTCTFKSAPLGRSEVEIAYQTFSEWENRGHGTAMVRALLEIAANSGAVEHVVAQTRPEENASVRICRRLHFRFDGEVTDPVDGKIWRWRKFVRRPAVAAGSLAARSSN